MSSCKEIVLDIGRKLEQSVSDSQAKDSSAAAIDLLKALGLQPITLEILQLTRIGVKVNTFRKATNNAKAATLAKELVNKWKKLVPDTGASCRLSRTASSSTLQSSASRSSSSSSLANSSCTAASRNGQCSSDVILDASDSNSSASAAIITDARIPSQQTEPDNSGGGESRDQEVRSTVGEKLMSVQPLQPSSTSDSVRIKCRELLSAALRTPCDAEPAYDIDILAAVVEDAIYDEFKNTEMKYKNKIRSRVANLKDPKNPRLREDVLLGIISASRFASMSPLEMASDEMKQLRQQMTKQAIDDHHIATLVGAKSDLFRCSRCGHRDTTYNQVQTLSSDEPMTTFVLCNHCGKRWKFW